MWRGGRSQDSSVYEVRQHGSSTLVGDRAFRRIIHLGTSTK